MIQLINNREGEAYCFESHTYTDVPINQMRFATYPGYVLQMIPCRPSVRLSRAPWVNNSTRGTTQIPQAVETRALTHPLKNLRIFSDGTVRRKMMNVNDLTGRIFKRIRS